MTPPANTNVGANRLDRDFEALWVRATNFEQDTSAASGSNTATQLPDLMMPQGIADRITDLAVRCHEQGLISDTQMSDIRQCAQAQQSIFSSIDQSSLRDVVASFQNG